MSFLYTTKNQLEISDKNKTATQPDFFSIMQQVRGIVGSIRGILRFSHDDQSGSIDADPNSRLPNKAWRQRANHEQFQTRIKVMDISTPVQNDAVRFVCVSDTHCRVEKDQNYTIPEGDVLLHAGDFSMFGHPKEVKMFNDFLGTLPHKHKVVIAGNHDKTFDEAFMKKWCGRKFYFGEYKLDDADASNVRETLTNCTYLQDCSVQIYGINIYGSPWSIKSGHWGFGFERGSEQCLATWDKIPNETDILITHGPPCGIGDDVNRGTLFKTGSNHVGCVDLLNSVQHRVRPKYHVFGHIHEGYGMYTDGTTTYINAATCTVNYRPSNPPIIFDIPLPEGVYKETLREFDQT